MGGNIGDVTSEGNTYIGSTINIGTDASTSAISLHQLRAPVENFVGRQDEIDQLVQAMCRATESGKVAIGGIRGLAGMGKTELAYAVAQRLLDTFPDAQLFLELRGARSNPLSPEQALQTIIRAFEPLAPLPDNLAGLRATYLSVLGGKRVLILADDALDKSQVDLLLPPPGCALLLTSRYRFNLPGMEKRDLEILPQSDAEKLLLEISPDIGLAAPRMARLCGRLPLALRICASMCDSDDSTLTIEDHLKALEDERARLAYMKDANVQDANDPATSVEASLQLSYAALDPQMQQVLCQLSVFPSSFDTLTAKAVVQVAGAGGQGTNANRLHMPVERSLDFLYRRSLVDQDKETKRFSLHDLVRVFGLGRLEGEEAVRMRHAQYYARVAAAAEELYRRGGENVLLGLKLFDQERANIDAGWKWARDRATNTSQEIDKLLLDYADSTVYVGDLRYDRRQERIPQLEAAVEAARRQRRRGADGSPLGNLGRAYMDLGEPHKAIQYLEQCLEIAQEMRDRHGEGYALGNLGHAYLVLGQPDKAIGYYEQILEIARQIGDRRGESGALGSLGLAYKDLGQPDKAIKYYEQHLQIARQIGDRRGETNSSWNLGVLLAKEGELARAIDFQQARVDYERQIGHTDADKHAAEVEELRKRLAEKPL